MGLSETIKRRRSELGLTLKDVADKLGVTEATVQRYESGSIKQLRHGKISKLAEILEVTPAELLGYDKPKKGKPDASEGDELTDTQRELLELILSLDDDRYAKVLDYIRDQVRLQNQ